MASPQKESAQERLVRYNKLLRRRASLEDKAAFELAAGGIISVAILAAAGYTFFESNNYIAGAVETALGLGTSIGTALLVRRDLRRARNLTM